MKGEIKADIIYNSDNFLGFLDIKPLAKGYALVISKKHFKTMLDMPSTLGSEFLDAVKEVGFDLIKQKHGEAINVHVNCGEAAGQIVHHFHAHIVPRKKGDGLRDSVV